MITLSPSDVVIYYQLRVPDLRQRGKRWRGPCPIHRGKHDSFSVDPETGLWRCWSDCSRGGDIIGLEIELTGATWREAVAEVEQIIGRHLIDRATTRASRRIVGARRELEKCDLRAAAFFRIAAEAVLQQILEELPEAVPERYRPTQFLLSLRGANEAALLALYRDFRAREPQLSAATVFAGEQAWRRLCMRVARFTAANMEAPCVAGRA